MNRRTERIGSLLRDVLGQLLLSKISDPRVDPALTSITHIEVAEDLLTAKVYVSVLGSESQQRNALRALRHAAGHIQELMMRQVSLRSTPVLRFELDVKFKKTLQTFGIIQQAMDEIRQKEQSRLSDDGRNGPDDATGQTE